MIVMCCVGFNNVDLDVVKEFGIIVVCVFVYLLELIVEYMVGLMMILNCRFYKVY